ncbi:TetR/AcrR family transcriptional regulator [Nocardioides dilutus]
MPVKDKRERLVAAATELSHRVGLSNATLAIIAEEADVPIGNVYYYFKSRDELAAAVVGTRREEYDALRRRWDAESDDPAQRLISFVRHASEGADLLTARGCPIGGLCSDLTRTSPDLGAEAGEIFAATIAWAAVNYSAMAHPRPVDAATQLVAKMQGATVLAHALGDAEVLRAECERAEVELLALRDGD